MGIGYFKGLHSVGAASLKIGLTGGIGSGKTTVTDLFAELSVPIIDADRLSRESVKKGTPAYDKILAFFGGDVIDESGELRRDYLRRLVFDNGKLKKQLESIIHPVVRDRIRESVEKVNHPYCIISIPLLFESGLQKTVDRILVVDTPEDLQVSRACARDSALPEDIMKIIRSQIDRKERLRQADDVILNDRDINYLRTQVADLNKKYTNFAKNYSGTEPART